MIERVVHALIASKNEAADDVLAEALRLGIEREQRLALRGLIRRKTVRGLGAVIEQYPDLPDSLQEMVLAEIKIFYHALRECGRSKRPGVRLGAMKLIALGRQGKLAYVLSENLHDLDEKTSKAAVEAMVALAKWVTSEKRKLQRGDGGQAAAEAATEADAPVGDGDPDGSHITEAKIPDAEINMADRYHRLLDQRPEIESAVARAAEVHRGRHGQDLLRAALLLCDWPGSKTMAILQSGKRGGQTPMLRRLQQAPASEHVEAFLLAAAQGHLRSHFVTAFSHIDAAPVLDGLLRCTHWLKCHQLQSCMHSVTRGAWLGASDLARDIERRPAVESAKIADWLSYSGLPEPVQDDYFGQLLKASSESFDARLRLLRVIARRKRTGQRGLLLQYLSDPDERLARLAAREIVRRRGAGGAGKEYESGLLQHMTKAPQSVRQVITRAIGQTGFEQYWQRFDRLDANTRSQAGRAMLKILPDAVQRLQRRLTSGSVEQRLKAMQMTQELGLAERMRPALIQMVADPHPRVRSKAVSAVGKVPAPPTDLVIDRLINDSDPRVRANAIDVLDTTPRKELLPVLVERARSVNSRERANAIKALHKLQVGPAGTHLLAMLRDSRADHKISAMWALKAIGWWRLLDEVGRLAKEDGDVQVRKYAINVLRNVAELAKARQKREVAA
jgi:HEAT repeat protein